MLAPIKLAKMRFNKNKWRFEKSQGQLKTKFLKSAIFLNDLVRRRSRQILSTGDESNSIGR